jgi:hypothetical protein
MCDLVAMSVHAPDQELSDCAWADLVHCADIRFDQELAENYQRRERDSAATLCVMNTRKSVQVLPNEWKEESAAL